MWISKDKLEALEHRIKRLEERDTMPRMVVPANTPLGIYHSIFSPPDTVPVVDVVQKIVDHLDLCLSRTIAQPSMLELKKRVDPWAQFSNPPAQPVTKPQKRRK